MTAAMVSRSGLRDLSWDELAAMLAPGTDETTSAAARSEALRRDRLEKAQAARDAERRTWEEAAHAQYLAADAVCRGVLLSRQGKRAGVTEWSLWSGPEARAMRYASEELREFWHANPRVTVGRYRQQATAGRVAQREDAGASPAPVFAEVTLRETTVMAGSWPRAAWWVIRAGRAALYFDRDAAVAAVAELLKG